MKRILPSLLIANLFLLSCCTPLVTTKLEQSIPQSSTDESIKVIGLNSEIPADAEVLGTVKIGDTGFTASKNCTFQDVLNTAKDEAKKAGGNAIKIVDHIPPGKSTCHRITVKILRLVDIKTSIYREVESKNNYAILNIYCESDTLNVDYDLHLNDSIICKINKNIKKSIAIRKEGLNTLWAEIDKRAEIQINIEFGQTYYLKCDLLFGDVGKQPLIILVDTKEGGRFFNLFW
jgi:hypothetical protein